MPRKKIKLVQKSSSSAQDEICANSNKFACDLSEFRICSLPNEILEMIFSYLDPQSLVTIRKLGIERLTEHSLNFKTADFSVCNTISFENVSSFFTRDRSKYIKEINFNNLCFVNSGILVNCIEKCIHLTILFVYNCGITYSNIISIFDNCPNLKELYWTLQEYRNNFIKCNRESTNVEKLYLHITTKAVYPTILYLLRICPVVKDVCLNFSSDFSTSLYPNVTYKTFKLTQTCVGKPPLYVNVNGDLDLITLKADKFVRGFLRCVDDHHQNYNFHNDIIDGRNLSPYLTHHSPFLQFLTDKEDLAALPSLPNESVHSMVIVLTETKELLFSHLEKINNMSGKALKNLSLYNISSPVFSLEDNRADVEAETTFVYDILTSITSHSCNISVLNLSELHYEITFPFSSLHCLKNLKVLSLASCCFQTSEETLVRAAITDQDLIKEFEEFVLNCKKMKYFSIYGCTSCIVQGPADEVMVPISKWKELDSLTLCNVHTFRRCQFLSYIADSCSKLRSIELIEIGNTSVCHYIPSIIDILHKSKQLTLLRINQSGFYPMNQVFWRAVGSGHNLQGLCLSTESNTPIVNKPILDALEKLPSFHLFHLIAKRCCQNLGASVKRVMSSKGVKFPDVKIEPADKYEPSNNVCEAGHFFTYR